MSESQNYLIRYLNDKKEVRAKDGEAILDLSLRSNIHHAHACGGKAQCSSCRVIIEDGLPNCSQRSTEEDRLARRLGFNENVRLACQTTIHGDIALKRPVLDAIDIRIVSRKAASKEVSSIGQQIEATILFADIASYTTFTESVQPYDLVHILNRYYYIMGKVIRNHNGRIIDYYGDGFLAVFGMDGSSADQAENAIKAGLSMKEQLKLFNGYMLDLLGKEFSIRIGVHTGKIIAGTIGFDDWKKLAIMGDAVNLASRIDVANKELGTEFLVSEKTLEKVKSKVLAGQSFHVPIKGKSGKYKLIEILGWNE